MWAEAEAGPSRSDSRRQGYCGYCRIFYSNLDKHLSSLRHLELVRASSSGNRTKCTLLERFLQDVIHHHPHHYKDSRPSHADLPTCSAPLVPCPQVEVAGDSGISVGNGLSDDHLTSSFPGFNLRGDLNCHSQSGDLLEEERLSAPVIPQDERSSALLTLTTPFDSQATPPTHRKAHRKSNRRKTRKISPDHPEPASRNYQKQEQDQRLRLLRVPGSCPEYDSGLSPGPGLSTGPCPLAVSPWLTWQKERRAAYRDQSFWEQVDQVDPMKQLDQVDPMDKVLLPTWCQRADQDETNSFDFSIPISIETRRHDNDASEQGPGPVSQQVDLSGLRDSYVDLKDQMYSAQLDSALKKKGTGLQREGLPDLFPGKTWEQMEREDEERIQNLVKQFRTQNFICYFDSESLARYGRRSHSKKRCVNVKGAVPDSSVLPLLDKEEDDWASAGRRQDRKWRNRKRRFRVASRCQVVKVSHSTQTAPLVMPRPVAEAPTTTTPPANQEWAFSSGTAPPPWLRLPPPYISIVTPVQPHTSLVYLLTPPSGPSPSGTPLSDPALRRCRRKQRPLEAVSALTVRYKRLPLRLYQPRTNRILRTACRGSVPSGSVVRQLFRSLNPDLNRPPELRSTVTKDPTLRDQSLAEATPIIQIAAPPHARGRGRAKATTPLVKKEGPQRIGRGRGKKGQSKGNNVEARGRARGGRAKTTVTL